MTRFFVEPEELGSETILLTGENAAHAKVLRLKEKEQVLVCNGAGEECLCAVAMVSPQQVALEVLERRASTTEAAVQVSVYMAFPKADKLEHVIQKATELGAYEIVAFPSGRCVSRPDEKKSEEKSGALAENRSLCGGAVRSWTDSAGGGAEKLSGGIAARCGSRPAHDVL